MSIALATKFAPYTDELFKAESKTSLLTNTDFDWSGAHTVSVWKISTVAMQDYARNRSAIGESDSVSRYGDLIDLSAQTEDFMLTKDRSFIFNVDKMDTDETSGQVEAASALAREIREVVIPEVDKHCYTEMVTNAGTTATAAALTKDNIYNAILDGSEELDNNEIPDTGRVLVVTPAVYNILKQAVGETAYNDVDASMRQLGVVSMLDGMAVVKVPAARLPENFGFMIAHPSAAVAPVKLEDYGVHEDTPLSSGAIVTGRIIYDCFVLDNKAKGIYYHPVA
jgi:hypothetical protein